MNRLDRGRRGDRSSVGNTLLDFIDLTRIDREPVLGFDKSGSQLRRQTFMQTRQSHAAQPVERQRVNACSKDRSPILLVILDLELQLGFSERKTIDLEDESARRRFREIRIGG